MSASQQAKKTIVSAVPHEMGGKCCCWQVKQTFELDGFSKTFTYDLHQCDPMTKDARYPEKEKTAFTQSEIKAMVPDQDARFDAAYEKHKNPPMVATVDRGFDFGSLPA